MNDGVKILLERMQTHPEEFAYKANEGTGKWGRLLENFKHCFTSEEITAVEEGIKNIERTRFTELVLEELIDPKKSKWETVGMVTSNMPLATTTPMPSISNIPVTPSIEQTLVRLKEIQKEYEAKPHKTIFGKLFNYQ